MKGTSVWKWVTFCGLFGLAVFCFTFISLNQWGGDPLKRRILSILAPECSGENTDPVENIDTVNEIQRTLDTERRIIRDEMMGYKYPDGKYNINATKLEDLVIEANGKPIRSIVLSTWRSGSSFLGGAVNAHPGDFHHYEPLADFDFVQIRGPPLAAKALKRIRALLNCQYADADKYIEVAKTTPWIFKSNTHLWNQCENHRDICYSRRFLSSMCKLFPFQSMKLVRLRLNVAQDLLADEKLAVRMVLLVRDPRGTLESRRRRRDWCHPSRDCSDPSLYCADLVSDHTVAMELLKKYPTTFRIIRYEDLAADPYKQMEELYKFYGRHSLSDLRKFLDTYTTTSIFGPKSRFVNTKANPFHWKTDLKFEEVEEIQRHCSIAMKLWGYLPAVNATHLKEFNPVTDYVR